MIRLPVSLGEALDKLTILEIKLQKIQDPEKRSYCKTEYDTLASELESYRSAHDFSYRQLRAINLAIWEMQDDIRVRPSPEKCVEILDKNDMRFHLKDVINRAAQSYLREQKGYPARRALVMSHLGLGDHVGLVGAVRYIAMQHDETVIICTYKNADAVASMFSDNPTIVLWRVDGTMPTYVTSDIPFTSVYRSGVYASPNNGYDDLPSCFYRDMGLDPEIRHTHFHVPTTPKSIELYEQIRTQPYVFVQQKSSTHTRPLVTWDPDTILTIDPNLNVYSPDHRWHELAQTFVDQPFLSYKLVIQHAKEIHTVDSSFYCLACYLPLDADVKRCYARITGAFISTYNFT